MAEVEQQRPIDDPGTPTKSRWTRLAALGFVMLALSPILLLLAAFLWGLDTSEAGFFIGVAIVALIGAFLVSRFGTWAKAVGIVLAIVSFMPIFWTAFGLFSPAAFFDFVPGVLSVLGVLSALIGSIAALVASRRGHHTSVPEGGERRALRIIPTVVVVLAVLSAVMTFTGRTSADPGGAETTVVMSDFEYDKDEYQVQGGSTVYVRNDDPYLHSFTIEELDVDVFLTPGSEELIEIPAEAGEYVVFCVPHTSDSESPSDDDMASRIIVQ